MGNKSKTITIVKDTVITYPELYLDVYLTGEHYEIAMFAGMFARARCRRAATPDKADLVVFAGGPDVNPSLYNEKQHFFTQPDDNRDRQDVELYAQCNAEGIPMFGVCRGAQFLHVMNGGTLYQDLDGHQASHGMWDLKAGNHLSCVSSVHHQAVVENLDGGMTVLATTHRSTKRWINDVDYEEAARGRALPDIEAFFYEQSMCLGVQGHPEYPGYESYTNWCLKKINELIIDSPRLKYKSGVLRIDANYLSKGDVIEIQQELN